jgi:pimeloyl-ACP methyl ester carboxylesterase
MPTSWSVTPSNPPVEVEPTFVGLPSPVVGRAGAGGHPCQGLWHRPAGSRPRVAFIAAHYNIDFAEHHLAEPLARRGFGFLGWNTRFRGNEATFLLDHALAEIGVGVRWLRQQQGVERVVLLGNSGGGSLLAAYQSQAVDPHLEPMAGLRPVPGVDELPTADLYVSLAAHPGRPEVFTAWIDPSVTDEADPTSVDGSLDLYHPANTPPFDESFLARYRRAQRARNDRITAWAEAELARLTAAGYPDRLFAVPRLWADPRFVDPSLDPNDRPTPWCYLGDPARANRGVHGVGVVSSLRTWLNMWSLDRSPCRARPHLARITVPSLVVQASADAGVFPSDARAIFDGLAAVDRELVTMTGDHYFAQPTGARDEVADLLAAWVSART